VGVTPDGSRYVLKFWIDRIEGGEIDMSLLEASNFRVSARPDGPTVSVLYKPTRRRYTYTAIARSRRGFLASGFYVDRIGHFGNYDDSEIQRHARRLALATAKKMLHRS
jgi:hypothetical protein